MIDELSRKRGDRVKDELKVQGMTQVALAKELEMSAVVLNDKLAGRKPLTEYNLQDIAQILGVRIEYLMLYDNDPTLESMFLRLQNEGDLLLTGLACFAKLNGYAIKSKTLSGDVENAIRSLSNLYSIEKDGMVVSMSVEEMNLLENEINDLVKNRLNYLFKWKEANNG